MEQGKLSDLDKMSSVAYMAASTSALRAIGTQAVALFTNGSMEAEELLHVALGAKWVLEKIDKGLPFSGEVDYLRESLRHLENIQAAGRTMLAGLASMSQVRDPEDGS